MRVGRDLEREFALLDRVSRATDTAIAVVLDNDHPRLFGLALDLGAAYVLPAGRVRDRLTDLVIALMNSLPMYAEGKP